MNAATTGASLARLRPSPTPAEILKAYRVPDCERMFLVGSFDNNVTVLSQQIRSLNLAYALVETDDVWKGKARIAIVGTGFAGLTLAAALIQKRVAKSLVLFEERDTLVPLQQGSDSRWLHPQIYDWPAKGSQASAAMLPVLNWTAGRASDVVVQVLSEWKRIVDTKAKSTTIALYCDTLHIQIDKCKDSAIQIEWVGNPRDPATGDTSGEIFASKGGSEKFDLVILAVGFGLEKGAKLSYWRNETVGQPSLNQDRATYLVSGQGDGALIDLLRLRISQFRQDRILDEMFGERPELLSVVKELRRKFERNELEEGLFEQLEHLTDGNRLAGNQLDDLLQSLKRRLRRDTFAILQTKVKSISLLFNYSVSKSRISFQNALLVFLLYKCGGFAPNSGQDEEELRKRYGIKPEHVIRRRGVDRKLQFSRILPEAIAETLGQQEPKQDWNTAFWPGGYFSQPGPLKAISEVKDKEKGFWRKEYLPGPTALVAAGIAGAASGALRSLRPTAKHFRMTLHRVISVNDEALLQQACDYVGVSVDYVPNSPAGRTFTVDAVTIGQAYLTRQIIRSRRDATAPALKAEMERRKLLNVAQEMKPHVDFLLAIPIVQPEDAFFEPSPVLGVLFVDSRSDGFWLCDDEVAKLRDVLQEAVRALEHKHASPFNRIRNVPLSDVSDTPPAAELPSDLKELEIVTRVAPPQTVGAFHLNFEHSDLTPLA